MKATLHVDRLAEYCLDWYWALSSISGLPIKLHCTRVYADRRSAREDGLLWAKEHNIEIVKEGAA
jgi:hypothetical protein